MPQLQQFWLDAVSPLAAILEYAEVGKLSPEKAVASVQVVLYLMGNVHQHMAQERHKKLLLKLNPSLKFMSEDPQNLCNLVRNLLSWPMPLSINRRSLILTLDTPHHRKSVS